MKKKLMLIAGVALLGASMAMADCPAGACAAKAKKQVVLCKSCGEAKGSASCCKKAEKCPACGAVKGSAECAAACKK